jgi:hypothetical protein
VSDVPDEDPWKRRFFVYTAVRVVGLAIFFLGLAIAYSNLIRDGGWPQFGAIVAILGAIDTVFAPRLLKRSWDRQDQQNKSE